MFSFCSPPSVRRTCTLLFCLICAVQAFPAWAQSSRRQSSPKPSPSASPKSTATPASAYVLPETVATVNGDPLHKAELEHIATVLLAAQNRTPQSLSDADKKKLYASVLDDMITDRLVRSESASETVNPLDVQKRFDEMSAQYPTAAAFDAEIKKSGQTVDQVRENLRIQLAQQQWIEHQIADQITVAPDEAEKFYKDGPSSKFDAPEMVKASHILVQVRRDAPPEDVLMAENKINELAARLKKGESFEELAKTSSEDPKAKETGGNLGYFSRERIMPEFSEVAFKLKNGEVSAPVRTQFGFHLIKVMDHTAAHTATFDEAHEQIDTYLKDEKRRAAVAKLIQSLRDKADIKIFLPS